MSVSVGDPQDNPVKADEGGGARTPRSESRILISPPNDCPLSDSSVRRELLSDDVVRVDEVVCVVCQRVDGCG